MSRRFAAANTAMELGKPRSRLARLASVPKRITLAESQAFITRLKSRRREGDDIGRAVSACEAAWREFRSKSKAHATLPSTSTHGGTDGRMVRRERRGERRIEKVEKEAVGGTRLELVTSTMSTWRSNQLS